jgi:hypothetical protein
VQCERDKLIIVLVVLQLEKPRRTFFQVKVFLSGERSLERNAGR